MEDAINQGVRVRTPLIPFGGFDAKARPATTNDKIAIHAMELVGDSYELAATLRPQQEIALCLERRGFPVGSRYQLIPRHFRDWVETGMYVDWFCAQEDNQPIIGVYPVIRLPAYLYHAQRIALLFRKRGYTVYVSSLSEENRICDPDNGQIWTRANLIYIPFDYFARLILLGQDKI
jgi:hypothetical protein